jgi:hypothetical protein
MEVAMRRFMAVAVFGILCAGVVHADVSMEEKTQAKFAGVLGRMVNLFGGRGAREGIVSTVAVKGDRKVTRSGDREQIVDLKEEKVYDVDLKGKSYTVKTFAEIRREMEEARRKAAEQAAKDAGKPAPSASGTQPQTEVDFSLKESGQRKAINGFDAREVVLTITVREKGKTLEQNGGLVMTANTWLAPKIAAMKEVADFDRRYAEKLALPAMIDAQQMAAVVAMYPMMTEAMKRMQAENVNLDGTPVMTVMTVDAVASAEQAATQTKAEPKEEAAPKSLGGLAGRLARRVVKKGEEPAAATTPGRANFMTTQHEVLKVATTVAEADLQIPAGFKQK